MAVTGKTTNFNIPLATENDHFEFLVDYNGAMNIIDSELKNINDSLSILQNDTSQNTSSIEAINSSLDIINETITSMNENIQNIENYYGEYSEQLQEILAVQNNYYAALESINTRLDNIQGGINDTVTVAPSTINLWELPRVITGVLEGNSSGSTINVGQGGVTKYFNSTLTITVNELVVDGQLTGTYVLAIDSSHVPNYNIKCIVAYSDGTNLNIPVNTSINTKLKDGFINTVQFRTTSGYSSDHNNSYLTYYTLKNLKINVGGGNYTYPTEEGES